MFGYCYTQLTDVMQEQNGIYRFDRSVKFDMERIRAVQQQRAAIARALANDPPIVATDEPTGNLDTKTAESVMQLFKNLVADGKTILMVTHDNDLANEAERTIVIADGEIVKEYKNNGQ